MNIMVLTDAPFCRDVRAQRTADTLLKMGSKLCIFDQGFDTEKSRSMLPEDVAHFSNSIPKNKLSRLAWHLRNNLLPRLSLNITNEEAYRALCQSAPDVVHLINPFLGDAALRYICEHPHCKLVYEAYEYWPEYLFDEEFGVHKSIRNHLAAVEHKVLEMSTAFISVSEPIVGYYREKASIQASSVIYNANVKENVSVSQSPVAVNNPLKVVFSGQFAADRNVDLLLNAVKIMRLPISVTLLGRGPQKEHYIKLIEQLDIGDKVVIDGPVPADELIEKLNEFDVGVHLVSPQTRQQNGAAPNKIFDYIRANLAIVSVETDGVKSLGLDECIAYISPLDARVLAKMLDSFAEDENCVLAIKQKSAQLKNRFTSAHESEKLVSLYRGLVEK